MSGRSRKLLWWTAAGCIILSLFSLGTLSSVSLQIIAIWITMIINKDQNNKEIFRLRSEIWALKSKIR